MLPETAPLVGPRNAGSGKNCHTVSTFSSNTNNDARRLPSMTTLLTNGPVCLENTGSTARDHLANERTYLAWMRTGLALVGASLALLKWDTVSNWAGYLVAFLGIVVLLTATHRYFRVMQLLERQQFEPNIHGIVCIVSVAIVAIIVAFVLQHTHGL